MGAVLALSQEEVQGLGVGRIEAMLLPSLSGKESFVAD